MVDVKSSDDTQTHVYDVAPEVASASSNSEVNATRAVDVRRRWPRIAYYLAGLLVIPTGLLTGHSRLVRAAVLPYIEIVRPIPAVAWIPLAILMWPTEESSIVYITFLRALFPIILNTVHGVEQTPDVVVVDNDLCIADKGCRVCIEVCPLDVLWINEEAGKAQRKRSPISKTRPWLLP